MSWWAGRHIHPRRWRLPQARSPRSRSDQHYVIYLGGIDSLDGSVHTEYERPLLRGLEHALGSNARLGSVFPYAISGEALLSGPRFFRWLWRALRKIRQERRSWLTSLINARNFFQLLVSADRRYGPIFNEALAERIFAVLSEAGWRRYDPPSRLTLVGYSGGVQIAIGAAPFLARAWHGPIGIISIGGTILAPAGLDYVDRLDHLVGSQDLAVRISAIVSAARWPLALRSSWWRAIRSGRIHRVSLLGVGHTGAHGYLGAEGSNSRSHLEATLAAVLAALSRPVFPRAPRARFGGFRLPAINRPKITSARRARID
ncbi:MAG TPA: hypothetical protein VHC73_08875 [Vitreimonas sp.]|nr:hypothetical protein [Vitreimonas sp.]